jgi:hypothetical protein
VLSKAEANGVSYWAGFVWGKTGSDFSSWKTYVDNFAQGLLSPIEITISTGQ